MDIKKVDIKKTLMTGTVMAVMSGVLPPLSSQVYAGTATVDIDVDIVTAIELSNTNGLDFGRIAITSGGPISGSHTLSPLGVVNAAVNTSVVVAGTPGNFDIGGGTNAANVTIAVGPQVSYNAGNIIINQLTFGGPGLDAPVVIAAGGNGTAEFAGGGQTDVRVGGRIAFSGTPAVGTYTGSSMTVTITDIP